MVGDQADAVADVERQRFRAMFAFLGGFALTMAAIVCVYWAWLWIVKTWLAYRLLRMLAYVAIYFVVGSVVLAAMVKRKPHIFATRGAQMNYPMTVCVFFLWPLAALSLSVQLGIAPARKAFERGISTQG